MTDNDLTPDEPTPDETPTPPPVRVPNVSPNAVSGLDHIVIGSNAVSETVEPDNTEQDNDAEVETATDVEGTTEEGGGGEAVNAETGEVTPAGEPLPEVEDADPATGGDGGTP